MAVIIDKKNNPCIIGSLIVLVVGTAEPAGAARASAGEARASAGVELKEPVRGLLDRQGPAPAAYQSVVDGFVIPPELEATRPPETRSTSRDQVRLMVSDSDGPSHRRFHDLLDHLT